jgi:hypothetical protein
MDVPCVHLMAPPTRYERDVTASSPTSSQELMTEVEFVCTVADSSASSPRGRLMSLRSLFRKAAAMSDSWEGQPVQAIRGDSTENLARC